MSQVSSILFKDDCQKDTQYSKDSHTTDEQKRAWNWQYIFLPPPQTPLLRDDADSFIELFTATKVHKGCWDSEGWDSERHQRRNKKRPSSVGRCYMRPRSVKEADREKTDLLKIQCQMRDLWVLCTARRGGKVDPVANHTWTFSGSTNDEPEPGILWTHLEKTKSVGKDNAASKSWRLQEKRKNQIWNEYDSIREITGLSL